MEAADLRPDNAACSRQDLRFTASYSIVSGSSRERRQTRARSHETVIVFGKTIDYRLNLLRIFFYDGRIHRRNGSTKMIRIERD